MWYVAVVILLAPSPRLRALRAAFARDVEWRLEYVAAGATDHVRGRVRFQGSGGGQELCV